VDFSAPLVTDKRAFYQGRLFQNINLTPGCLFGRGGYLARGANSVF